MFVYSSYHLNISFPSSGSHFNKLERVLETLKNGFVSTVTLWITLNKTKNITNNFTKLITNIKNNNHASINYDASVETLSTAYIPISFLVIIEGILMKTINNCTGRPGRKTVTEKQNWTLPLLKSNGRSQDVRVVSKVRIADNLIRKSISVFTDLGRRLMF